MENNELEQIEGTVVSVIYQNPENGYTVMRLNSAGSIVTAVGCMPGIAPGESILLTGQWTTHQSYGEQFKAQWAERRMPVGKEAIYRYLSSGAIKNIGPAKAKDIVDRFGDETLEVIENEPEKLAGVRGISKKLAIQIGAWFRRQVGLRRLMEFLSRYAIKPNVAVALYKNYGDEALEAVKANPYIMVSEDFGAEFFEADAMALQMGFEPDCQQRIEAAIIFELRHNLGNGHTFLPKEKLLSATNQLIEAQREYIEEALTALCDGGYIVNCEAAGQDACYLTEIYEDETYVADRLLDMVCRPCEGLTNEKRLVDDIERKLGVRYALEQRRALELAAKSRVMVLTGGLLYLLAPQMMAILTPDPEIITLGTRVLRIEAFAEPMFAASIVASGVFHGAGDTLAASLLNFVSMWCVRLPIAAMLAPRVGLVGVWVGMAVELCVRGVLFLIRLAGRKWENALL